MAVAIPEDQPTGFARFANYVEEVPAIGENVEEMQFLDTRTTVQKTPISFLQELCVKKQVTPIYELLASEGQVHEPTFIYRVIVDDMSATGQGKSKKVAKHNAAKNLLERIVAMNRFQDWLIQGDTKEEAMDYLHSIMPEVGAAPNRPESEGSVGDLSGDLASLALEDGDAAGNPIGRLQEMCLNRRWPPPRYELIEESGMPHDKTFIITVYLGKFEQSGKGRSKKIAKRVAADKMLKFLHELPEHKQDEELAIIDEENPEDETDAGIIGVPSLELDEELAELGIAQQSWGSFGNTDFVEEEEASPSSLMELMKMDLSDESPSIRFQILLNNIALEEQFNVKYQKLDKSLRGEFQCLVTFGEDKAVCHGSGATLDDAEYDAAKHALEYLQVSANL